MQKDHAPRALGFAGSALISAGGLGAGALPVGIETFPGGDHARIGLVGVYSGLSVLVLAWWWYGRVTRHAEENERRDRRTLALWTAPMLIAPPMFSRDVYSYLAQGLMIDEGLNVYRYGPAVLGGRIADQVPAIWQHTPSPYGPVFLMIADAVSGPLESHLFLSVIAMRLVAVAGLVLLAGSVRVLARSAAVSPAAATWLAVLNPLTLIHLVGGAHNDALMVGLLAAGLAAAVHRRPILATQLVVAAALVKVPAALGLCAVALIWAAQLRGRWAQVRAGAAVTATAAAATVLITAAAGTGYGWISALGTPISPQNWSLTSGLARLTTSILAHDAVGTTVTQSIWRWAGMLAILLASGLVWTYRTSLGPVYALGVLLVVVVAFGPAVRPWYLVWGLAPLAAVAGHERVRRALAAVCAVLVPVTLPDGFAADGERVLLAVLGALIGIVVFLLVHLAVVTAPLARMFR